MKKPTLLLIVHQYHNRAGIEYHVKTLAHILRDRYEVFTTFPHKQNIQLLKGTEVVFTKPADPVPILAPLRAPSSEIILKEVLERVKPDIIHLAHFVFWPLSIFDMITSLGVPVVTSFHDYYLLTPYWTMQGEDDPLNTTTKDHAERFFKQDISNYLKQRREFLLDRVEKADAHIVAAPHLKRTLGAVFPFDFKEIPYGIVPFEPLKRQATSENFRFGYFGSILPQKGWDSLLRAFLKVREQHPTCELHFHGGTNPTKQNFPGVTFHGVYEPDNIPELAASVDVGVIPSTFAETYSIVLSELWQAGLPPAVSRIGAMGDRVVDGVNGKLFEPGDVASIEKVLTWFLANDEWRDWELPTPYTASEMGDAYHELYQGLINGE